MTCAACQAHVERSLRAAPGVLDATVNLLAHSARVMYAPAESSPNALVAVVSESGYEANLPAHAGSADHVPQNKAQNALDAKDATRKERRLFVDSAAYDRGSHRSDGGQHARHVAQPPVRNRAGRNHLAWHGDGRRSGLSARLAGRAPPQHQHAHAGRAGHACGLRLLGGRDVLARPAHAPPHPTRPLLRLGALHPRVSAAGQLAGDPRTQARAGRGPLPGRVAARTDPRAQRRARADRADRNRAPRRCCRPSTRRACAC